MGSPYGCLGATMHRLPSPGVFLISIGLYLVQRSFADVCADNSCANGATCQANLTVANAYFCVCPEGYEGEHCQVNVDDCAKLYNGTSACTNGGTCTDAVNGFECLCAHGFSGPRCETRDYWTLQQWQGNECQADAPPWRCFRLQMDKCVNTGLIDGTAPNKKPWFGRLKYNKDSTRYTIDLCWGEQADPEESCNCENHYENVPRLGKNSLGPPTSEGAKDSNACHKLMKITSSKLVSSTGKNMDAKPDKQNLDCAVAAKAAGLRGMLTSGVLMALLINAVRGM